MLIEKKTQNNFSMSLFYTAEHPRHGTYRDMLKFWTSKGVKTNQQIVCIDEIKTYQVITWEMIVRYSYFDREVKDVQSMYKESPDLLLDAGYVWGEWRKSNRTWLRGEIEWALIRDEFYNELMAIKTPNGEIVFAKLYKEVKDFMLAPVVDIIVFAEQGFIPFETAHKYSYSEIERMRFVPVVRGRRANKLFILNRDNDVQFSQGDEILFINKEKLYATKKIHKRNKKPFQISFSDMLKQKRGKNAK